MLVAVGEGESDKPLMLGEAETPMRGGVAYYLEKGKEKAIGVFPGGGEW